MGVVAPVPALPLLLLPGDHELDEGKAGAGASCGTGTKAMGAVAGRNIGDDTPAVCAGIAAPPLAAAVYDADAINDGGMGGAGRSGGGLKSGGGAP